MVYKAGFFRRKKRYYQASYDQLEPDHVAKTTEIYLNSKVYILVYSSEDDPRGGSVFIAFKAAIC